MSDSRAGAATKLIPILALAWLAGCSGSETDGGMPEAGAPDAGLQADATVFADATVVRPDAELVVPHDGGSPPTCNTTCDCAQGLACINNECRALGTPVYCCEKANCPSGQACLDEDERPEMCPGPPDAGADAGANDLGAGYVGASCDTPSDCTQVPGMTCWTRFEEPFVWGYCTVENCVDDTSCPGGSRCLGFNVQSGVLTGCLQECQSDSDCRSDAYCLYIPQVAFSICLPDCRDDLFDCTPRDGTVWCNRSSGLCENLSMQNASASVGDACLSNADCGPGDVCIGDQAVAFPGGLCTRVCSGLPEASPCDIANDETCQDFLGIGLCFKDCVNNTCPDRPNAFCGFADANWLEPSCIPM